MSWRLKFDGTDDRIETSSARDPNIANCRWTLKASGQWSSTNYTGSGGLMSRGFRLCSTGAAATHLYAATPAIYSWGNNPMGAVANDVLEVEYTSVANGSNTDVTLKYKKNGGTQTTVSTQTKLTADWSTTSRIWYFGRRGDSAVYWPGELYFYKYDDFDNSANSRLWDADASSHGSGTPTLYETLTGTDHMTASGMLTDGSAWEFVGGSDPTIFSNISFQNRWKKNPIFLR